MNVDKVGHSFTSDDLPIYHDVLGVVFETSNPAWGCTEIMAERSKKNRVSSCLTTACSTAGLRRLA